MANDLTITETKALATINTADPFLAYADAVHPQHILGSILKHSKGEYLCGEADESIPLGTKMIAAMDLLTLGYVEWRDGKPAAHFMTLVASGEKPPRRDDLGDTDPWEKGPDGKARDPFQFSQYLPLCDEAGEVFTFSTSARGGISALAALARQCARGRAAHPDKFPVIELQVDSYQHSTFGKIKTPKFVVVGWESKSTFFKAAGLDSPNSGQGGDFGAETADEEMSDSIPF
jgi:hypothetical protein